MLRLDVDIAGLRADIIESLRAAIAATGHRIVNAAGIDETERKIAEMANNLAGGLVMFADDEKEAA